MRRLVVLALACVLPWSCGGREPKPAEPKASVEVVDLAGLDAALAKHRGHGVLLNFWALWCAPCVAELPELMEVAREFQAQGGRVVLVSYDMIVPKAKLDPVRAAVTDFAREHKLDVPILIYDAPDYEAINAKLNLPGGVPVTLAIDAEGRTVEMQDGPADKARFQELMRRAIAGK